MCCKSIIIFFLLTMAAWADEKLPLLRVGSDCFTNVTVTKVTATDIFFTHGAGMGNAKLKNVEPELQRRFHYDVTAGNEVENAHAQANAQYHKQLMAQPVVRPPDMTREPEVPDKEPEIIGSVRFSNEVSQAMQLLEAKDTEAYAIVKHYVGRIREGEHSGMWASETPPTFELNDITAFTSQTWCAATIAHDSFHSKLYHDYLKAHGGPVPYSVWEGMKAEQQCMKYQLVVMEHIGATKREMDWATKEADGNYIRRR